MTTNAGPAAAAPPLLDVQNLSVDFSRRGSVLRAVDDVSFQVAEGEVVGVVGESGSGKSVTARAIMRLVGGNGRIASGTLRFAGRDLLDYSDEEMRRVRGNEIAMVFQDSMVALNPLMRIGKQIGEVLAEHQQMGRRERHERCIELLRLTGIPDPEAGLHALPAEFSGGMLQRVVIAMALACNPRLLIADEPTTALDVTIEAQVLRLLARLQRELGMSIIIITHDLGVVAGLADRVNIMYAGRIVESGPVDEIFRDSRHPYTRGLLGSIPRLDADRTKDLEPIPGAPPDPRERPSGCSFHPRCEYRIAHCVEEDPPLDPVGERHSSACWVLGRGETGDPVKAPGRAGDDRGTSR